MKNLTRREEVDDNFIPQIFLGSFGFRTYESLLGYFWLFLTFWAARSSNHMRVALIPGTVQWALGL